MGHVTAWQVGCCCFLCSPIKLFAGIGDDTRNELGRHIEADHGDFLTKWGTSMPEVMKLNMAKH